MFRQREGGGLGVAKCHGFQVGTWRIIPVSKWLGSPPFISHKKAIWKGNNPTNWDDPPSSDHLTFDWLSYIGDEILPSYLP